ncbi:MAG TPA: hypothetical protein VNK95_06860 [Caldilineaceae bacterium]|nr:hypothetical protein [Caldilineaceae bacterium]
MLEKPIPHDEEINSCLCAGYGLAVAGVEFLPIGNKEAAWQPHSG